ncbi:16S rRNA (cytosine(1402)-N(4))-methyltransferase RsmH [Litorimonas sp. RW-G-Af-16]|uniref:16S rRNA (cytosine(1402)-N(4))-methyltransferase RsmH n=1 Tax=Litorimonas sp. RW-G-Af-16 TaxID=3241168 RepID=UPI003AACB943
MKHYPVMLPEVLTALAMQDGEVCVDGTFGNGGYSEAILNAAVCNVIGLDRDPNVAPRAESLTTKYEGRFRLIETPFSKMDQIDLPPVDAVVLDIGVSSMQLDQAERGFSFMREGPLDMRMGQTGPTAADAVAHLSVEELTRIFQTYGEEKRARHIANHIQTAREAGAIATTTQLADIIEGAIGRRGKTHPATRAFQALRIFINDELGELYRALCAAENILKPGGRLVVVTFHSLEDRIVKQFFRERSGEIEGGSRYAPEIIRTGSAPTFDLPKRSVTKPSKTEIADNARSRSAKLRLAVRTDAAPMEASDMAANDRLPTLAGLEARL